MCTLSLDILKDNEMGMGSNYLSGVHRLCLGKLVDQTKSCQHEHCYRFEDVRPERNAS